MLVLCVGLVWLSCRAVCPTEKQAATTAVRGSRRARQSEAGGTPYTQETGEEAAPLERRRGSARHGERWHAL